MTRWRELPIVRTVARGATRQRVVLAVAYLLLVVSCEDPLAPDSSSDVRIQAEPAALSMIVGQTRPITARVIDGRGATLSGARVFWATDNVAVATVSESGIVSGIAPGTARVSASSRGKSTIVPVTVHPRPTALVRVTPQTSTIREGEVVTLHAEPVDAAGDVVTGRPVQWTSSSEALAIVSSTGVVTGVSGGRATITATVDGVSGSAVVVVESAPVATVSVTPTTVNIFVGRSLQLSATTADSLGRPLTGRRIIWASSAPAVASVSSTGQVIGLAPGTATITAISEGKSGSSQITVALVPVAAISIIPTSATLSIGRTATLFARLLDADGEVLTGRAVTWVSDQPNVVSVMSDGVITAVSIGQARITATAEGKSGSATIDVVALSVSGLTVSPNPVSLEVGRTQQLTATARDGQGNVLPGRIVSWVSGGPTIATVSQSGLVTAVSPGTALIIANSERQQAVVTVTVSEVRVDQVTVTPSSGTLELGRTLQLSALIIDATGAPIIGKIPTWTTSSPAVATVSASGVVTAVGLGTATITATSDGVSGVATISVVPVPVARVSVLPSTGGILVGSTLPLTVSLYDAAGNPLSTAGRAITWTSSAPAVASVSGIGVVSAISAGVATISVQCEGVTGQSVITVSDIPVASVSVTPPSAALNPGGSVQFAATAKDANGNVLTGRLTSWSSSDASVATVSATGLVTAVAVGSTQITAVVDGVLGTASVSVSLMPIASIFVAPNPATVVEGQTMTLTAIPSDSLGNVLTGRPILWASGDIAVATVSQAGVVTAIAPGNVTITASAPNAGVGGTTPVGSRVVSVTFAPVGSVAIVPTAPSIIIGTPTQLAATLLSAPPAIPLGPVGRTLTWSVDDAAIATISASGVVTGIAAGTTRVRVSASSPGQVTPATNDVPLTVSLVQIARIDLTPLSGTIHVGSLYARQVTAQAFDANNNPLPGRQISWSTSDPTRLLAAPALTSNGITTITALAAPAGGLMIIASAPGASGVVADTVTISSDLVPVSSVVVAPSSATLLPSQTRLLTPTARDSAGNAIGTLAGNPLAGRLATWVSADPNVGTVNSTGLVTAVAVGQTTIGVSIGGVGPATFVLSVVPVPVRSVSVTAADSSITTGTTVQATAIARDSANNVLSLTGRTVVWTSSSPAVATVSASGVVTALAPGIATIAVTVDGVGPATFVLTVSPIPVASVVLSASDSSLTIGDVVQATVVARDAANNILPLSGRTVVWTSNTPAVATISTSGVITALGLGAATIGVTVDGVGPATFTVIVAPIPVAAVGVTATDSSLTTGTTTQATVVARDAANNVLPLTGRTVVWTSSATGVASVSASGLVTAVAAGSSTIGVTVDGVGPATFGLTVSPPSVASVSVTATDSSLTVGMTAQATVVARDAANNILPLSGRTVVWTSSATSVATVSASGLVTAVAAGSSTIGVTVDGVGPTTFLLTVTPVPVASVSVSAPVSSLTTGTTTQATVVARDAANNVLPLTGRTVVWSSSASSVATVSPTGLITAVGVGSATISVIVDFVGPATFLLAVTPVPVASVSVSAPVSSLTTGTTTQATVVARDAANNILPLTGRTVVWTSSATGVATVSASGLVTAVAAGSSTIGVTVDGVGPATFLLTVTPVPVASVSVTAPDSSLTTGTTTQATVVARDAANNILPLTGRTLVWSSSATGVATVSAAGLVTAVAAGSATIGVTVDGVGPATFPLTVTPVPVASVSVTAPDSSISAGVAIQATAVARDAANNILPLTGRTIVWTSGAPSVATVSASGLVSAVAAGSSTIGVTVDGVGPATFLLTVTPIPVASVSVSAPDSSLTLGDPPMPATVVARDAANNIVSLTARTVVWTSSAPGTATVSASGIIAGVGVGTSTIGVTVDGVGPATFVVTVAPVVVASVSVTAPDSSISAGVAIQATVVARDAANNILPLTGRTVVWTSSATGVATVSASGLVTAVAAGSSTIGVTVDGVGPATFILTVSPPSVASVGVSAPDSSLTTGTTTQATVVARDAANNIVPLTGRTVVWTSSATGVATVSASGLVTAVAAGSSTIGVTVDGVGPATFLLTVTPAPVASVSVTAADSSLTSGTTTQATVVARDAANNILPLTGRTIVWTSSATGVATVSASGLVTAVAAGGSTIGVTVDGVGPATFLLTVTPVPVASVSVTAPDSSISAGVAIQATVVARDAANNVLPLTGRTVVWTSSAPGVATVSASGLMTAVAAGSSTIGVTVDGVGPATFLLTVTPVPVASVSVTAPDSSLTTGTTTQATVVARDAANNILPLTGRTVVWTSSATGVATVSASGLVTAVAAGSSTIGVTVDGVGPATFLLTVTPVPVASVSVSAPDSSLTTGTTTQATVVARDAANNILSLAGRAVVWTSSATSVATVSTPGLVTAIGAGSSTIGVTVDGVGPATFGLTVSPPSVASVSVTATDSSLTVGGTAQATVVARDATNNIVPLTGRTVVWTSGATGVATVSAAGLVTAIGVGSSTIGVTVDGVGPATFVLSVAAVPVASVSVTATDSSLTVGGTAQATADARDAANNVLSLAGRTVVWSSSTPVVATVSSAGSVTAVGVGTTTIGVTVDGVGPATFLLIVAPTPVASVSVTAPDSSLTAGDPAMQATVVARDAANNILPLTGRTVVWASSATGVATVSASGLVTAVAAGSSTIGVTVDGVGPATFILTVAPSAVASVSVTAPDSSLTLGDPAIQATVVARDAANNILSLAGRAVFWTSSATGVATVSTSGLVTAVAAGSATIAVTVDGVGPATFGLTVTPVPVATVSVTAPDSSLTTGTATQATVVARDAANNILPLTGRTIVWTSSATGVATVSALGLVTAVAAGSSTIGVTVDGVGPATFGLTVSPPSVATVTVTAPDSSLTTGTTTLATVVARDAANNILPLAGRTVVWTSSATGVATVSASGLVTALATGTSTIGVTVDGVGPATFGLTVTPVPVATVSVTAPDSSLTTGTATQATVVARDVANNILPLTGRTIVWTSSAPGVATVSTSGLVTAVGAGSSTIGVTVDGVGPATFGLTVSPPSVASVSVTAPDSNLVEGTTTQATVVARDAANNILPLAGRTVVWTSSATGVATVSASGLVTALATGTSTIGVTVDGVGPATFGLTVTPVPVATVSVTAPDSSLTTGTTTQATAVARDAANNILPLTGRTIVWTSSAPGVATVSTSGLVTAVGAGSSTIGVTVDGVGPATFGLTVSPPSVASVSVTAPDSNLVEGTTTQATVVARDAANNILSLAGRTVVWTSSATGVATVSASGLITAVLPGSSTIGVTVDGVGPATFGLTVSAPAVASVSVSAPDSSLTTGTTTQATVVARDAANNILPLAGRTVVWTSSATGVATVSASGLVTAVAAGSATIGVTVDGVGPATFLLTVTPVPVASVSVSAPDSSLTTGTTTQATVVARDAANNILPLTGRTIVWTSSAPGVATVSTSGLVTAVGAGSSTIGVTVDGVGPATFGLTVSPPSVASVSVTAPDSNLVEGTTTQATVVARDAANNILPLAGRTVVWTSSATGVATVSASGLITAVLPGSSTIGVTVDGVGPATFLLTVTPAPVASVSVTAADSSLTSGTTTQATVVARDAANNILPLIGRTVVWTSSATNVATVSTSGLVTAIGAGTSTIGVTVDGIGPATFILTVSPPSVASVSVSAPDSSLTTGTTTQATVVARDAANNILPLAGRAVVWTSSATGVATVSASGLVTAVAAGSATIGVTVDGVGPATFGLTVTPVAVVSVSVSAPDSSLTTGTTTQATVVARDAANNVLPLAGRTVVWTSSATGVATVSASGLVTAMSAGASTIGVTVDGVGPATFGLTVTPVAVASVSVSAPDSSLTTGTTTQATVVARDAANNILPLTGRTIVWTSSATGVATVSASGLITAVLPGSSTIGVTVDGVGPATFGLTVSPPSVASVSVTAPDSSLVEGTTTQATVVARDALNIILPLTGRTIVWTSSATGVATVSASGLITAVSPGSSTIGVTVDGVGPATFLLTVTPVVVASVSVSAPDSSIALGDPALQATVVARDAANNILSLTGRTVVWSSSDASVATVSASGLISPAGAGTSTIGVTVDGVGPATFALTVAASLESSEIGSVPNSSLTTGNSTQATVVGNNVLWFIGPATSLLTVTPGPVASVSVSAPDSSMTLGDPAPSGDRAPRRE